jgi:formamidopyrimidine-DNA glycosylase
MSYHCGGATISTYKDGNGNEGMYNRRFAVYNQKTDPFGNNVIKEKTRDNRTTHWVPEYQT